ncbi:unnamed protein product [Moneuplotes crassus]|uniref:Uncharacterized protein n=1 Tax=Euplotes crassus TaxID=5936 RepID=A0AAD1Y196_EUPCR|nr:unnamed protein product [Moneuplotes crassus]
MHQILWVNYPMFYFTSCFAVPQPISTRKLPHTSQMFYFLIKRSRQELKWSTEEHNQLVQGLKTYGKEWHKIDQMILTKSSPQIRYYSRKYFNAIKQCCNTEDPIELIRQDMVDNNLPFNLKEEKNEEISIDLQELPVENKTSFLNIGHKLQSARKEDFCSFTNNKSSGHLMKYCGESSSNEFFESKAERSYAKSESSQKDFRKAMNKREPKYSDSNSEAFTWKQGALMKAKQKSHKCRASKKRHQKMEVKARNNKLINTGNNIYSKVPYIVITNKNNTKEILPLYPAQVLIIPAKNEGHQQANLQGNLFDNTLNGSSGDLGTFSIFKTYSAEKGQFVIKENPTKLQDVCRQGGVQCVNIQSISTTASTEKQLLQKSPPSSISELEDICQKYCHCFF